MDQQEEVYSKPFEYTLSLVGGEMENAYSVLAMAP